jgi:hypothetical protein
MFSLRSEDYWDQLDFILTEYHEAAQRLNDSIEIERRRQMEDPRYFKDSRKFEVKDGGERIEYASGMQREPATDKIQYDLVYEGPLLRRWAIHLTKGALKYARNNWMKANSVEELERFRASAARHFAQWMSGDMDEDHAAAVIFNMNGVEYIRAQRETPQEKGGTE